MEKFHIFYSWQSDLPNNTNRSFIERTLLDASKTIEDKKLLQIDIDQDTRGVPGAPDIAETILRKIEQAQIFVCDVSIVNSGSKFRKTPNPNVLFELGYAFGKLGYSRIITVFNTAYGKIEHLPFDFKTNRLITYHSREKDIDKAPERRKLRELLEHAIESIINSKDERKYTSIEFFTTDEDALVETIKIISARHHVSKEQMEQIIKNKTSLYTQQARLLIEYFIDFEYVSPVSENSQIYTLGLKGRELYRKHTLSSP